jgi:hypothetical protein
MAIISLVLGIVGLPLVFCCFIGLLGSIPAVVLGFLGLNKAKEGQGGRGLALAGMILGGIGIALAILFGVLVAMGDANYNYNFNN